MAHPRGRFALGISSLLLLVSASYVIFRLPHFTLNRLSPYFLNTFSTAVSSFNIVILLGWLSMGALAGITLTVISMALAAWAIILADLYSYPPLVLSFLAASFAGYLFLNIRDKYHQTYILKLEKSEEDINILANNVKEREKSIESLEDKLKRYSGIKNVLDKLNTALSVEGVTSILIEGAVNLVGKDGRILIFLVDLEKQELELSASKDTSSVKEKKGDIFDQWVLRNRKPLMIEDITKDFRFPLVEVEEAKEGFRSLIAVPLMREDKVIGVMRMDDVKEFAYSHDDLRIFGILADLGAVSVQNASLYMKTQELAIKDGLTGLFMRRHFMERFKEEIKRAARKKGTFSVLLFDIDKFKDYNDRYGHTAGDLVLKHLSRIISSMTRDVDIAARFGGEEMILLMIGASKSAAAKEAELIRKHIENKPLTLRRKESKVTVSVGVSNYPEDAASEDELLRMADERLYKAKELGRNRVCAAI